MNNTNEDKALLLASALLQYPDENWQEVFEDAIAELEEINPEPYSEPILNFIKYARNTSELDLAEQYVHTFDFTKKTNLYLTYYSFKERRDRGEALLKLKKTYKESGFFLTEDELPDFLPVILEYSSAVHRNDILKDYITPIKDIFNNLSKINSPYAQILKAILMIIKDGNDESGTLDNQDKPMDYVSLGGVSI